MQLSCCKLAERSQVPCDLLVVVKIEVLQRPRASGPTCDFQSRVKALSCCRFCAACFLPRTFPTIFLQTRVLSCAQCRKSQLSQNQSKHYKTNYETGTTSAQGTRLRMNQALNEASLKLMIFCSSLKFCFPSIPVVGLFRQASLPNISLFKRLSPSRKFHVILQKKTNLPNCASA